MIGGGRKMAHAPLNVDPARVLTALLNSSTDAIFSVDLDGRIQMANRAAGRMLGHSVEAIVGRVVSDLVPTDRIAELALAIERSKARKELSLFQTRLTSKDGRLLDVSIAISPIEGPQGRVTGFTLTARDITDRLRNNRALQIAEARWRALVDSTVDGMIIIDASGGIEAFNPAAERLFGYGLTDVLGQNVRMLMPSPDRELHDQYISRYMTSGVPKIIGIGRQVTGQRRDGSTFPLHLSVGEMRIGDERHFVGMLHDLSARASLEERVREQTALARLGQMAAVLAHEVRNPLTAVRGAIQVLGKRLAPDGRDMEVVREILARLDRLNELVQDLLLFARTPQPRLAPIELRRVLKSTTDLLAKDPVFGGVRFEIAGDAEAIAADADLLKIAFQNIILNAAQAMQGRGRILASISAAGTRQTVAIADDGPGIPPETRARLFEPFFTTKARGTGLGLATVRRLVEAQSGRVFVECPDSGGTTVTIELSTEAEIPAQT
jgi:two-component system sensor kinase FixL